MVHLCSNDLSLKNFLNLVDHHPWENDSLLMAFTPAEAILGKFIFDSVFLSHTEQGRIFSPIGELCWRRMDNSFRLVYLGESLPNGLSDYSSEIRELCPYQRKLLLWGERTETENEWLEQPVPHRFSYPICSTQFPRGRAALIVEDWKDAAEIPRFSRYHSIIEVEGGK